VKFQLQHICGIEPPPDTQHLQSFGRGITGLVYEIGPMQELAHGHG
jgi:hypothetical protein